MKRDTPKKAVRNLGWKVIEIGKRSFLAFFFLWDPKHLEKTQSLFTRDYILGQP